MNTQTITITFPEKEQFKYDYTLYIDGNYNPTTEMANNIKLKALDDGSSTLVKITFLDDATIKIVGKSEHHTYKIYNKTFELSYNIVKKVESLQIKPEYDTPIEKRTVSTSLSQLQKIHKEGRLIFDPPYQRDFVWTLEQKQFYISNLFKDMAELTPTFCQYIDSSSDEDLYEIIDGKQRISAILEFIDNKFPVEELYYKDLHEKDRDFISRFRFNYTRILTKDSQYYKPSLNTLIQLFLEINLYGTRMSDDDLNKAKAMLKL